MSARWVLPCGHEVAWDFNLFSLIHAIRVDAVTCLPCLKTQIERRA